jgi:hypothetical protein
MNTVELKNILISKISEIDDDAFLQALKTILDSRSSSSNKNYLEEYNNDLLKAEEDIESGKLYSHDQVKERIKEWKKR